MQDLQSCIRRGEGVRLEWKRILPREERAARTLCAFANTRGGLLLVGVTDRGKVHGVHHPEEVCATLLRIARHNIDPPLPLELQVLEVGGPRIVACSVPWSKDRPHALLAEGGERQILVRVGSSNQPADGPTLRGVKAARRSTRGLGELERKVLEWVSAQARSSQHPGGTASVARFAQSANVGEARARRSFVRLETLGLLVGHGAGRARIYHPA
ncbi:MAG: ATP-binding protein [Planctomycetes bacterium]|nr:ATP-binding protein [Planctomycetota bacterium]